MLRLKYNTFVGYLIQIQVMLVQRINSFLKRDQNILTRLFSVLNSLRSPCLYDNRNGSGVLSHFLAPGSQNQLEMKSVPSNLWKIVCQRYCQGSKVTLLLGNGESRPFFETVGQKDKSLIEVVEQLKEDHGVDICVIETSEERKKYADYVIVASGRTTRHLRAMTNHLYEQVQKLNKKCSGCSSGTST